MKENEVDGGFGVGDMLLSRKKLKYDDEAMCWDLSVSLERRQATNLATYLKKNLRADMRC